MGDPIFAERLQTVLKEGLLTYGQQLTPVVQAQFPSTEPTVSPEIQSSSQVNVTAGETKPLGEPRTDQQAEQNGGLDPEVMGEVSSLLVSIGYILSKESIIPDKFDTQAVVTFLGKHFPKQANVPCEINTPPCENNTAIEPNAAGPVGIPQEMLMQKSAMYESRQLLEKQWKK